MAHSTEIMTIDGANIRVLRGGPEGKDAQPLVFLHGAGGHTGWMAFLEELSQRFAFTRRSISALASRTTRPGSIASAISRISISIF